MLNLTKKIEPGTWRYLGLRCPPISPIDVPIAGVSIEAICGVIKGDCYRIGRINPRNAFIIEKGAARFLYVRPNYTNYRTVARRVFPIKQWSVDFDHALAKNICNKANLPFAYVLMLRVSPRINRQHGSLEKLNQLSGSQPNVCFADDRILDKWLGRSPYSRMRSPHIMAGYSYSNPTTFGLTLKQKGFWAYAIGMEDYDLPKTELIQIDNWGRNLVCTKP